ncbi:MAG: nickel pincer cofactor biosynthesis protein LarB [Myxococcales bacterium]|nr:MAG: nickel pincer cofactor biosynthesis protein LarB [Myxococcales bacterium]
MDPARLERLLKDVAAGRADVAQALDRLRRLPFEDVDFAVVDHHRLLRTGVPEVIYGESKTVEQIVAIARRIVEAGGPLLATRLDDAKAAALVEAVDGAVHYPLARIVYRKKPGRARPPRGLVAVITAGTSDIPVAEEAAIALELMGERVERFFDVGVAGLHRLLDKLPRLHKARACVVAAGMEGALASIVGGLVACPVVALPTSVGYGASFAGLAALLGMLTSCTPGVVVVNIDNGFGAGVAAGLINRRGER